jgi:multimeric flavodoxin WrbA
MKVTAINGSPRKNWNTAILLGKALEGAALQGAETELVHLYDLDYKGCRSCFECKKIGGKSYGRCAIKDELTSILEKIRGVDALILGSPIYLETVSGEMRSFMERLLFPYTAYDYNTRSLFPKRIPVGFIYVMGCTEEIMKEKGYEHHFDSNRRFLRIVFPSVESLMVLDTLQFDDYSKYVSTIYDPEAKAKRRREIFPRDCEKAFEMGARLAGGEIRRKNA